MERFFGGDDRRIRRQREVDSWIRHQVCLELVEIHIERPFESQRSGDRGDDLSDDSVQVAVRWSLHAESEDVRLDEGRRMEKITSLCRDRKSPHCRP